MKNEAIQHRCSFAIPNSGRDKLVVGGPQELPRTHRGASQPGGRHDDEVREMLSRFDGHYIENSRTVVERRKGMKTVPIRNFPTRGKYDGSHRAQNT